jgi:uncharacterized protein (TIGR00251 family)
VKPGPQVPVRVTEKDGAVTLDISVKPRSSREGLTGVHGDRLCVSVNAPPVDGKANEAVVRVLAQAFGVPRSAVSIVRGETGRKKTIRLAGVDREAVERAIAVAQR